MEQNLMAVEVRQMLASMSLKDRMEILTKAVEEEDDAIISAALEGSCFLTNLTTLQQEHVRDMWRRKRACRMNVRGSTRSKRSRII